MRVGLFWNAFLGLKFLSWVFLELLSGSSECQMLSLIVGGFGEVSEFLSRSGRAKCARVVVDHFGWSRRSNYLCCNHVFVLVAECKN